MTYDYRHTSSHPKILAVSFVILSLLFFFQVGCAGSSPTSSSYRTESVMVGTPPSHLNNSSAIHYDTNTGTSNQADGAIWYQMVLGGETLEIRLRLFETADKTTFFIPGAWAGNENFSRNIHIVSASGPDGTLPLVTIEHQQRVDVITNNAPWVELYYHVTMQETSTSSPTIHPYFHQNSVFAYIPAILVLPSDRIAQSLTDIRVEINAPENYVVATTWPLSGRERSSTNSSRDVYGYIVPDVVSLRDAFVYAGNNLEVSELSHHEQLTQIIYQTGFAPHLKNDIKESIEHILRHYESQFGHFDTITIAVRHSTDSSAIAGMGRRKGFVLEIPPEHHFNSQTEILIAHEAFHLWNGHQFTPSPSTEEQTRWFKEGVTHYVALASLCRMGRIDMKVIRDEFLKAATYYSRNPAVGFGNGSSDDHNRLAYDFGLLFALALDLELYNPTNSNSQSLIEWIQQLMILASTRRYFLYDDQYLYHAFGRRFSHHPAAIKLWEDHIVKRHPLNLHTLFHQGGWHWLSPTPDRHARLLPLDSSKISIVEQRLCSQ